VTDEGSAVVRVARLTQRGCHHERSEGSAVVRVARLTQRLSSRAQRGICCCAGCEAHPTVVITSAARDLLFVRAATFTQGLSSRVRRGGRGICCSAGPQQRLSSRGRAFRDRGICFSFPDNRQLTTDNCRCVWSDWHQPYICQRRANADHQLTLPVITSGTRMILMRCHHECSEGSAVFGVIVSEDVPNRARPSRTTCCRFSDNGH